MNIVRIIMRSQVLTTRYLLAITAFMALHKACIHNYSDNIHIGRGVYYLVYPSKFITALNYAYIGVILREPPGTLIVTIYPMSLGIIICDTCSCFTPSSQAYHI